MATSRSAATATNARVDALEIDAADFVADNWRDLTFLREWACDGVVL